MGDFASCVCCCCSICVSALAKSYPRLLLQLLTLGTFYCTRARLTLEPSRLLCVLRFAFFLPPKANRKARRNFPPPRLWLKFGSSLASALRCAGDVLRTWRPRRACRLPPAARTTAELWETRARRKRPNRPAPRAHTARSRRVHGATRHVSRRAARASFGAQNGALPARRKALPAR